MDDIIRMIESTIDEEIERQWDEMGPPPGMVNIETGQAPTADEWETIKRRAYDILVSPYSSYEQIEWAAQICPDGLCIPYRSGFEFVNKNMARKR